MHPHACYQHNVLELSNIDSLDDIHIIFQLCDHYYCHQNSDYVTDEKGMEE